MRQWVITDTHFLDTKLGVACSRPANFTERIIKGWKREVLPEDLIIHLGDIGNTDIIPSLPGCKVLVRGNHDKHSNNWYYIHGWDFVVESFSFIRSKKIVLISHKPQPDLGQFDYNIHGHFHNTDYVNKDPICAALLTAKHYLYALEYHGYCPLLLDTLLSKHFHLFC